MKKLSLIPFKTRLPLHTRIPSLLPLSEAGLEVFCECLSWLPQCLELIQNFNANLSNKNFMVCLHLPYSLDLAPHDLWLLPKFKMTMKDEFKINSGYVGSHNSATKDTRLE